MRFLVATLSLFTFASVSAFAGELDDLGQSTFPCAAAGLNAAARTAAKAPTQGAYEFSSFKTVSASSMSAFEVGFTSNYDGEPDLKYIVKVYCQQGIDPNNHVTITLAK
jgi:hypothetical protein